MDWVGVVMIVAVLLVGAVGVVLRRGLDERFRDVSAARRRLTEYADGVASGRTGPAAAATAAPATVAAVPPPTPTGRPALRLVRDPDEERVTSRERDADAAPGPGSASPG